MPDAPRVLGAEGQLASAVRENSNSDASERVWVASESTSSRGTSIRKFIRTRVLGLPGSRAQILIPCFFIFGAFYYWSLASDGYSFGIGSRSDDPYNVLTSALMHGKLTLGPAPAGLSALRDPYNPAANAPWNGAYHDLALYHGHFFLIWGLTPVFTEFMPWRLLHVGDLSINLAILISTIGALAFSLALGSFLLRRFAPETRAWKVVLGASAIALCNIAPYDLRNSNIYGVDITSALCFTAAGFNFLARGALTERPRKLMLLAGSCCIALAIGARSVLAPIVLILIVTSIYVARRSRARRPGEWLVAAAPVLIPVIVVGALLMAYNAARFGSPLQFGENLTLESFDVRTMPQFSLSYLGVGLAYYFLAPIQLTLAFPYFALPPQPYLPVGLPHNYIVWTDAGIFTTAPIVVLLFALPWLFRSPRDRELRRVLIVGAVFGMVEAATVAGSIWDSAYGYQTNYVIAFLVAAVLVWIAATRERRRWLAVLGAVLILFGDAVNVAASITGQADQLASYSPRTYADLQGATGVLPETVVKILGHPDLVRVRALGPEAGYGDQIGEEGTYHPASEPVLLSTDPTEFDVESPSTTWALRLDITPPTAWTEREISITRGSWSYKFTVSATDHVVNVPLLGGLNKVTVAVIPSWAASVSSAEFVRGRAVALPVEPSRLLATARRDRSSE